MKILIKTIVHLKTIAKKLNDDAVSAYAAQSAFFIFLSFFPFTMLLLSLLKLLPFSNEQISDATMGLLTPVLNDFVISLISEIEKKSTGAIVSIATFTALWSASKGIMVLIKGLDFAYDSAEHRGYIRLRALSLLYTFAMIILLFLSIVGLGFGGAFTSYIESAYPDIGTFFGVLSGFRWVIVIVLLTFAFSLFYLLMPQKKLLYRKQLPGAFIAASGWSVFSAIYAFYIDNIANYSYFYGSLTAVVLLMLWLFICMYIFFLGAEINDILTDDRYLSEPKLWLLERRKRRKERNIFVKMHKKTLEKRRK